MFYNEEVLLSILEDSVTSVPNLLLSNYKKIGLTDKELIVIIHLIHFKNKGNHFPSISELENRMTANVEEIMKVLQRLVRQGYIYIEEHRDQNNGIIYEVYNITPTYIKLLNIIERNNDLKKIKNGNEAEEKKKLNIFKIFEQEFGRPLSPIEIELISTWIDKDKHSEKIIMYALKEAVFSNKLSFRYIDSILLEWQKKNIKTIEQIREHVKKFRENKNKQVNIEAESNNSFEFYNWLDDK